VEVVLAEALGESVDVVGVRGGGAPRVVAAVPQLHVQVHAGERRAAGVEARAVELLLDQDLRHEVAHLRPHHRDRVAAARLARGHEQRVRLVLVGEDRARVEAECARAAALLRRRRDRRVLHAAGIGHREAAPCERAARLVREALAAHGVRRLGVVLRAEVAPVAPPLPLAESLHERLERLRRVQLAPAALAEDAADERGRGHHVGALPRLERDAQQRVLGRLLARVDLRLGDVLVHARDVLAQVIAELHAALAVDLVRQVDLKLEVGLVVGRQLPLRAVHLAVGGGAADERRQLRAAGVAQHVHQEQAVLRRGVARAEQHVAARLAVDVRHAVALVAHDRHAGARVDDRLDVLRLHPEGRVLEVVGDLIRRERGRRVQQVHVHVELVGEVRWPLPGRLEAREVDGVVEAVRARREHVAEATGVVLSVRERRLLVAADRWELRRGRGCGGQEEQREDRGRATHQRTRNVARRRFDRFRMASTALTLTTWWPRLSRMFTRSENRVAPNARSRCGRLQERARR
jgi:hypothetical protein